MSDAIGKVVAAVVLGCVCALMLTFTVVLCVTIWQEIL
jgi:hypothetical protein